VRRNAARRTMNDTLIIAGLVLFFLLSACYAEACDKL
jgi:hypothetical protein